MTGRPPPGVVRAGPPPNRPEMSLVTSPTASATTDAVTVAREGDGSAVATGAYQVMPPLSTEEYAALKADIAANGVRVPITLDQHGNVIDGHHRKQIADELGVHCPRVICDYADPEQVRELAFTLNLARRHLTREQKRELIAAEIERRPADADRAIARRLHCSPSTVGAVRVSNLDTPPASTLGREEAERITAELVELGRRMHRAFSDVLQTSMQARLAPAIVAGLLMPQKSKLREANPHAAPELHRLFDDVYGGWFDCLASLQQIYRYPPDWHDDPDWRAWLTNWGRSRPDELRQEIALWLEAMAPEPPALPAKAES